MTTEAGNVENQNVKVTKIVESSDQADQNIVKMRDSDIKWRAKYKMTKAELEDLKVTTEKEAKSLQDKVNNVLKEKEQAESKLIDAKLESLAVAAGITDLDLVKLIDKSAISVDESGQITGINEAVQAFKQAKPNFFGAEKKVSSSSNAATITQTVTKPIHAKDMSAEEWNLQKRKLMSGGFR